MTATRLFSRGSHFGEGRIAKSDWIQWCSSRVVQYFSTEAEQSIQLRDESDHMAM